MDVTDELARLQRRMEELQREAERLTAELDQLTGEMPVPTSDSRALLSGSVITSPRPPR